jgi:IstB-like ATP binding protein
MKLFFAAPLRRLPSDPTALGAQASRLHFVRNAQLLGRRAELDCASLVLGQLREPFLKDLVPALAVASSSPASHSCAISWASTFALCEREIARKDERRIEMTLKLARFPFVRDLLGFDFAAQFLCQKPRTRPNLVGVLRLIAAAED